MKFIDLMGLSDLTEGKDLSKYAKVFAKLTNDNNHQEARKQAALLTGDKKLIELVNAIDVIIKYERSNPISVYTNEIYTRIHEAGRKKYGTDEWNKNIYANT
jgi:hypothetical protein